MLRMFWDGCDANLKRAQLTSLPFLRRLRVRSKFPPETGGGERRFKKKEENQNRDITREQILKISRKILYFYTLKIPFSKHVSKKYQSPFFQNIPGKGCERSAALKLAVIFGCKKERWLFTLRKLFACNCMPHTPHPPLGLSTPKTFFPLSLGEREKEECLSSLGIKLEIRNKSKLSKPNYYFTFSSIRCIGSVRLGP